MRLLSAILLVSIYFQSSINAFGWYTVKSDTVTLSDSIFNFQWNSLIQGNRRETAYGIARDNQGNIYIAGETTSESGVAFNAFDNTMGLNGNAFIGKFTSVGEKIWITYFGGSVGKDVCTAIAVDATGNVVITGSTYSYQNDLDHNGFDNTYGQGLSDAFVAKFDTNGNRLWASYLGGSGFDTGTGIVANSSGDIYVTGMTDSPSGIAYKGPDLSFNGYYDAFLTKVSSSGELLWSSYFGGEGRDIGNDLAVDGNGNVYMVGSTWSETGIALNGFDNVFGVSGASTDDAFIAKFDPSGNQLWGTYFGGNSTESGDLISLDAKGNIFISGVTYNSTDVAYNGYDMTLSGYYDVFLAKFNPAGIRVWATYFGGVDADEAFGMDTDEKGSIYIVGQTHSHDSIAHDGFDNEFNGNQFAINGFIAKYWENGDQAWASYYNSASMPFNIEAASANEYYITGTIIGTTDTNSPDVFLTKLLWEPRQYGYIAGTVFSDRNGNCVQDEGEDPIPNLTIYTEPSWFSSTTDEFGNYTIKADTGIYLVKQHLTAEQEALILQICENPNSIQLHNFNDSITLDIGVTIITGLADQLLPSFDLYPNPSAGSIILKGDFELLNARLYNAQGVALDNLEFEVTENQYHLTLDKNPGLYIIEIKTTKGILFSKVQLK